MHQKSLADPGECQDCEMFRAAHIHESAEHGRNSRATQVIWASGFFDGEGSIGIYKSRRQNIYQMTIAVNQVLETPLRILVNLWGGNIYGGRKGKYPIHRWILSSRKALVALEEMLPYLVNKREQAELAMHFQRHIKRDQRGAQPGGFGPTLLSQEAYDAQRDCSERMKALKRIPEG